MVALGVFRPEQIGPSAVQHAGKFGAMGLKGAVRLGYSKELEAQPAGPHARFCLSNCWRRNMPRAAP